jgi:hypothetical protein
MSTSIRLLVAATLAIGILAAGATSTLAAKPVSEHQGKESATFFDDFIFDVCGIPTMTTVTENWTLTTYADGSQRFTDSRRFVPADKRIPIEYGAGMSTFDVNGVQTVHGSPIRLRSQLGGGIRILDAGYVRFGDDITMHGPHPSLGVDLADYYCP